MTDLICAMVTNRVAFWGRITREVIHPSRNLDKTSPSRI